MSKIDRNLFERYCDIQAWSTFTQFAQLLSKGHKADAESLSLLKKIHKIYEVYHDIYIINTKGTLVASAINHSLIGRDFSNQEWFKTAINRNIYFSDIEISETLKIPVINFSAPIYGEDQKIIGAIVSRFNCNFINDIIKAAITDSQASSFLINQKGLVVGSSDASDVYKKSFETLSILQNFQSGTSGLHSKEEKFSIGYSFSKGYNTYRGQNWLVITQKERVMTNQEIQMTPAEYFRSKVKNIA